MTIFRRIQRATDWQVLFMLIMIAIGSTIFSGLQNSEQFSGQWWSDFSQNFSTEMFGAFLTFLLLEKVVGARNSEERLILQLRSSDNVTALNALAELTEKGWTHDGTLQGVNLFAANLQGADLTGANLQGSDLRNVKLQNAELMDVDLRRVDLRGANLQRTDLKNARLVGATLHYAKLQGTSLLRADLVGANLGGAEIDENTILPDGANWSPDVDMKQFTDPDHPEFWQPDWVKDTTPDNNREQ